MVEYELEMREEERKIYLELWWQEKEIKEIQELIGRMRKQLTAALL